MKEILPWITRNGQRVTGQKNITMIGGKNKSKKIIIVAAAVVIIAAVFAVLWYEGGFLPNWIKWENITCNLSEENMTVILKNKNVAVYDSDNNEIWQLDRKCRAQSILAADIDGDQKEELLILCWKIGRYGMRKPFWVKHDEFKWSQHIFIYEPQNGEIKQQWLASNIGQLVKNWNIENGCVLVNTTPEGKDNKFVWVSWGLEKLPDDFNYAERFGKRNNLAEPESKSEPEPESEPVPSIDIIMVGDILLHNGVVESCKNDGVFDFSPLFKETKEVISDADIAIVNQEVIIGGTELGITGYPSFNAPYEVGDALVDAGFDVICHATNHALDRGRKGINNCASYWRDKHPDVSVVGIYDNAEDSEEMCIVESNGIKVAILNYTYGTNGIGLPSDMPFAVNLLKDKAKIQSDIEYAENNADFTVVCPHWGIEYQLKQSSDQEKWAEFFVENGADLIIGTHPHVIEPIEWIETDNGNKGLCYYSLGNFINWTAGKGQNVANRVIGGMAEVEISMDEKAYISDYGVYPLVSHLERKRGAVTTYLLENYTEELANNNVIINQDSNFSYNYCVELSNNMWGDAIGIYGTPDE